MNLLYTNSLTQWVTLNRLEYTVVNLDSLLEEATYAFQMQKMVYTPTFIIN